MLRGVYAGCRNKVHYAECRYAERHGASLTANYKTH
jgi:hypothetical protein